MSSSGHNVRCKWKNICSAHLARSTSDGSADFHFKHLISKRDRTLGLRVQVSDVKVLIWWLGCTANGFAAAPVTEPTRGLGLERGKNLSVSTIRSARSRQSAKYTRPVS